MTRHTPGIPYDDDDWELYQVAVDRSECENLAAAEPGRLDALVELWWEQARNHGVLPLDNRTIELFGRQRRSQLEPDRHDRPPGRRGRRPIRQRQPELGPQRVHPGRPPGVRLQLLGPSVGYDHGSPGGDRYDSPFAFVGRLDRVDIQIVSARDAAAEAANAEAIARAETSRQ